ncbi:MAG TPA: lamin tail domain-containing protein [Chitinophagales bacterium]|nr:lamin tail domain-containing protein [Chitinophagales bacterium]
MKSWIFTLLLCVSHGYLFAQLSDDFTDGDFSSNPAWAGDVPKFEINAAKQLHLNAPAVTDTAYLSTPNTAIDNIEWDFFFILDFSPSASNYLKVYLVSDQQNFKQPLNGYFLKVGENGSNDSIELYLQQGSTETLIIHGIAGRVAASTNHVSVKVTRDGSGNWAIYSDTTGATSYTLEGTGTDNTITSTLYFGFLCNYTSSRSTLFYFDNIYVGAPIIDTIPPQVIQVNVISQNQLDVLFSEAVDPDSSQNVLNYSVNNGIGNPSAAIQDGADHSLVHLTFTNNFQNGVINTITISNVADPAGNILTSASLPFTFYQAQSGDVIINEIMADPSPVVALPDAEYAEIFNHSSSPVDLTGWTFSDGTSTATFSSFTLQPDSFLILCSSTDASLFFPYGNVMSLTSFPSLNNDGDDLTLKDASGNLINEVIYDLTWYHDDVKSAGGWSIERIDANSTCASAANWHGSVDVSGGTPGRKNSDLSAFTDTSAPHLVRASVINNSTIALFFNESVDGTGAMNVSNYSILPSYNTILSAAPVGDFTEVDITITPVIDSNIVYTVVATGMDDCSGNVMTAIDSAQFAIPSSIQIGDIIINEILFNPKSGGYDYVEIYNNTEKIFDLQNLQIANADDNDLLQTISPASATSYLFFPQQYIVLTANPDWVTQNYFAQNPDWFITTSMPSYNDDEGRVILLNSNNERIDELHYFDQWQFPLITNVEGVSLERIDPNRLTQDSMNWHSAATTVGYGTPTYKNSQFSEPNAGNEITLSPQVFSPDEDGYNDVLNISYQFNQAGFTANIKIFDAQGREVRNLIRNALLSPSGTFTWDGITERGEKARMGSYIVFVEVFDLDGTVKRFKKVCVVAARKS